MKRAAPQTTHVALLRGINLAGKNRLPMQDVAGVFRDAGCHGVRTYIQSGNVVFAAATAVARRAPMLVQAAIRRRFAIDAPVLLRTAAELRGVVRRNPFLKGGADPSALHVVFLRERPGKAQIASLDPRCSPPDEFVVRGREVYLRCPNGVGRSKLTPPYFDARLKTVSTARNWRTVLALLDLATG